MRFWHLLKNTSLYLYSFRAAGNLASTHVHLAKTKEFFPICSFCFHLESIGWQLLKIAREVREAGTLPRSLCFKWRAGMPHPPVYQASGAAGILRDRNARTE
eukprot:scaffold83345_cov69-Phaeocystis_antarctica.AAC.2